MTQRGLVLGIDLGTSGCKVAVVDSAGSVRGSARAAYPTASPEPAWAEQNPADWLTAVAAAVPRALAAAGAVPGDVVGLALTSAAHIGVLLDDRGDPVRPAILWNDQRTVAEVADLEREAGQEILDASCQAVSTGWTLPHLVWVRRQDPAAWKRTRSILLSKDFVLQWLTGRAATDPATAVSSQLYDVPSASWSPHLCGLAGITPDMLPEVVAATAQAGGLTATAAAGLGLAEDLRALAVAGTTGGYIIHPSDRQRAVYAQCFERYAELHRHLAPFYRADASAKPDPVALLRRLHESGQGLDRQTAESYLAQLRDERKRWRGQ
jgi:xylulokinase